MRLVRRMFIVLTLLIAAVYGAAWYLLTTIDRAGLVAAAELQFSDAMGQNMVFGEGPHVGLWPLPGIHTGPVSGDRGGITAPSAIIVPDPFALLGGEQRPLAVVLVRPQVTIGAADPLPLAAPRSGDTSLRYAAMLAGTITINRGGLSVKMVRSSVLASFGTDSDPVGVTASGDWSGRSVTLSAGIARPADLSAGANSPVRIDARVGGDWLQIDGDVGRSGAGAVSMDGTVELHVEDANTLARAAGTGLPDRFSTLSAVEGRAVIRVSEDQLRLRANLAATMAGRAVSVRTSAEAGSGWRTDGTGTVEFVSRAGGLYSAYLSGTMTGASRFKGQARLSAIDLTALQDWLGVAPGERLFDGRRVAMTADVTADPRMIRMTEVKVAGDATAFAADLTLTLGADAALIGSLDFDALDLTPVWANGLERLRGALRAFDRAGVDLALAIRAQRARISALDLGAVQAGLSHGESTATIEIGQLGLLDGLITGRLRLPTAGVPRLRGEIAVAELDAAAMSGLAGHDFLTGTLGGDLTVDIPDMSASEIAPKIDGAISVTDGSLSLPLGAAERLSFGLLKSKIAIDGRNVRLDQLSVTTAGGRYEGQLQAKSAGRELLGQALTGRLFAPGGEVLKLGGRIGAVEITPEDGAGADHSRGAAGTPDGGSADSDRDDEAESGAGPAAASDDASAAAVDAKTADPVARGGEPAAPTSAADADKTVPSPSVGSIDAAALSDPGAVSTVTVTTTVNDDEAATDPVADPDSRPDTDTGIVAAEDLPPPVLVPDMPIPIPAPR